MSVRAMCFRSMSCDDSTYPSRRAFSVSGSAGPALPDRAVTVSMITPSVAVAGSFSTSISCVRRSLSPSADSLRLNTISPLLSNSLTAFRLDGISTIDTSVSSQSVTVSTPSDPLVIENRQADRRRAQKAAVYTLFNLFFRAGLFSSNTASAINCEPSVRMLSQRPITPFSRACM